MGLLANKYAPAKSTRHGHRHRGAARPVERPWWSYKHYMAFIEEDGMQVGNARVEKPIKLR
jgi:hypothetical protein